MTAPHDLDRQLQAFLTDGPTELPDPSFDAVRDRMETTRQRVVLGPWRVPDMNKIVPYALGTAAVVVSLVVGIQFLRPPASSGIGADPSGAAPSAAVPSVQPSAMPSPTPSTAPSASPAASPPPLTQTFTSKMHGFSVSYPEGWTARAATEPWTDCLYCTLVLSNPQVDLLLRSPDDDGLFLRIVSQPIGESAPEDWVAAQMASDDRCTTTEPIIVDGATGLSGGETCHVAVVTTAGRGYHIDLYVSPDNRDLVAQYDRAWFEEVLATVQLRPEDAVDVAPSATP